VEVAIIAGLAAIGDMEIDASHFLVIVKSKLATYCGSILVHTLLGLISIETFGQPEIPYKIIKVSGELIDQGIVNSDSGMTAKVQEIIQAYRTSGYLLADVNRDKTVPDTLVYEVYQGRKYDFTFIDWQKFPRNYINLAGVRTRRNRYSPTALTREISRILDYSGEIGYPFAQVKIDSANYSEGLLGVQLLLDLGPRINFDTLDVIGLKKTKNSYLEHHLGIVPGQLYQQSRIEQLENKIDKLNFLSLKKTPSIAFVNNLAKVNIDLEEERINTFDGVIGLLQNEGDDRLTITGIVDLELYNLFGTGKSLELHWQQQRELSQSLDMSYGHPQLFKSALGLGFDYNQLKEDTTFVNRNIEMGLSLPWKRVRFDFSYSRATGRILSGFVADPEVPDVADFNIDNYNLKVGIGRFSSQSIRKQWEAILGIKVGDKRILRNPLISDVYYNSIDLRTTQYGFSGEWRWLLPIGEQLVLYQHLYAQKLVNQQLFLNDLFRLGGLNSLRGFNELEFFANEYALSNIELRWLWNNQSYFFGFYDQAFFSLDVADVQTVDQPLGVGAGVSLTTETGIFRLVYALGKSSEQPLSFNQAKIHFGFTSRF